MGGDVLAIALAIVMFGLIYLLLEGIDRI